jgi:hypothetical protein
MGMAAVKLEAIYRVEEDSPDPDDNADTRVGEGAYLAIAKLMSFDERAERETIPDDDVKRYESGIRAKHVPVENDVVDKNMETIPAPPPLPARGSIPDLGDEDDSLFDPTKVLARDWIAPKDDDSTTQKKPPVSLPLEKILELEEIGGAVEDAGSQPSIEAPEIDVVLATPEPAPSPLLATNVPALVVPTNDSIQIVEFASAVRPKRVSTEFVVFLVSFLGALIPGLLGAIYYLR